MPAVNPSRLQIQIEELLTHFDKPQSFHRRLQALFSLYANGTLRFGQSPEPRPTSPMYHLPQPLIRQLHLAIKPYLDKDPQAALACADELWDDPYFEIKQTAIFILGNVMIEEPDPILNRLESWIDTQPDDGLRLNLLSTGTLILQKKFPTAWERFIQSLLDQNNPKLIGCGLQGLIEIIEREDFENFPMIFRLISPIIQKPHTAHMEELENLVKTLIGQTPTETTFFLKQTLSLSQSPETKRLIKRCLPMLPEKERQDLKSSLSQ